jgi:hypothetical protein
VRLLTILAVVQTGLLILLFTRMITLDDEHGDLLRDQKNNQRDLLTNSTDNSRSDTKVASGFSSIDEYLLRQIIQEELAAYGSTSDNALAGEPEANHFDPESAIANDHEFERVSDQIDYFSSIGKISDTEMGELQFDIAKLDEVGRRAALRKLTRALNSKSIDGRFQ